jgi:hypothetical protein
MERLKDIEPEVHPAAEFLNITKDFEDPKEIIREAISNSFDAKASKIEIEALVDRSSGEDDLVIIVKDDGEGMDEDDLKAFFDLGNSRLLRAIERGELLPDCIAEKGHGTKVYFNSRRIEVETFTSKLAFKASMSEPWTKLHKREVPRAEKWRSDRPENKTGTMVKIYGYNYASKDPLSGFSHDELKDYILWFTKFGSIEPLFGHNQNKHKVLRLKGLGTMQWEEFKFGHPFPPEDYNKKALKQKDPAEPTEYYVRKLFCDERHVLGYPTERIQFVFYLEGDRAKREYNQMISAGRGLEKEGTYTVQQRYGLRLCKDYIPLNKRVNEWVAKKTEWTKWHAFVNCQGFHLTANRGDVGNTPKALMNAVEATVRAIFESEIEPSRAYQDYLQEAREERAQMSAREEQQDFDRRRRLTLRKKVASFRGIELIEPRQEAGVYSLFLILATLKPNLFPWKVVDYDTKEGYDVLAREIDELPLDRTRMGFLEFKKELGRSFDHSFGKLEAIITWDCNLRDGDEVKDKEDKKRSLKITPKSTDQPYTKYMLISNTEPHNIEVIVLKEHIKDKLGLEFTPRPR